MARRPLPANSRQAGTTRAPAPETHTEIRTEFDDSQGTSIIPMGMQEESHSLVVSLQRSAFDSQIAFALRAPRNINRVVEDMVKYINYSTEEGAAKMTYHVPKGGELRDGPSIRFAEVVAQCWRHNHSYAYVTKVNKEEMWVEAEGVFIDFETNTRKSYTHRRPIRTKEGKLYGADQINNTSNGACSIAVREAILRAVPRAVWENAYAASQKRAAGTLEGLPKKRQDSLKAFMRSGVAPDRVLATLGLTSEAQIGFDHINKLRAMYGTLQSGEATIDDLFPPIKALVPVEEQGDQKPKRKTLADLAEDGDGPSPEHDNHDGSKDFYETRTKTTAELESEKVEDAINDAVDAGRHAFHKGISMPPSDIRSNPVLAASWKRGHDEAAEQEAEQARTDDDEDTKGTE